MNKLFFLLVFNYLVVSISGQTTSHDFISEEAYQNIKSQNRNLPSQNSINTNAGCSNIDFELSTVSSITTSTDVASWDVYQLAFPNYNFCSGTPSITGFSYYNSAILSTPFSDGNSIQVTNSPLGGTKIVRLNGVNSSGAATSISQSFSVTQSNNIFNYAYIACFANSTHPCCDSPTARVLFRDSLGNIINAISETITGSISSCSLTPVGWSNNGSNTICYTPAWVNRTVNLSPYIGSIIKVEVIASDCSQGGHPGYIYFDAKCFSSAFNVNGTAVTSNSYSSCATNATITGPLGYTSYTWTGPSTSTVNNASTVSVSTNFSGNYSLSCSNGTVNYSSSITLSLSSTSFSAGISPSSTIVCPGASVALYGTGNGVSSYTWSNGAATPTLLINNLNSNTVFSVSAKDYLGCLFQATAAVNNYTLPILLIGASQTLVCTGSSVFLMATSNSVVTIGWNTGDTLAFINPSLLFNTVYVANATDINGCVTTNSILIQTSACTSLERRNPTEKDIVLFPNPTQGNLKVSTNKNGKILIKNVLAQIIYEDDIIANSYFEIKGLITGVYFVYFENKTYKIIVQN